MLVNMRTRRNKPPPNTVTRYTSNGQPYEVDKSTGERVFTEDRNAMYMTAGNDFGSYKYSQTTIDDFAKFIPFVDGKGTQDNPLDLSDDDDDNEPININNNNNQNNNQTIEEDQQQQQNDDIQDITPIVTDVIDEDGNVKLTAIGMTIFSNQIKTLSSPVLFKEQTIEIPTDMKTLNFNVKQDIIITIKYKDLTKFVVSFLKENTSILISSKEFSFVKHWLKEPKTFTNHNFAIPNEIMLKGIEKRHFMLIKEKILSKSSWIGLVFKSEEAGALKDNIIACYPPPKENPNAKEIVKITDDDMLRLEPFQYLNDTIIDFYIKYTKDHLINQEDKDRFYFFNTFFYNNLSLKNTEEAYKKISKWTKGADIFSKDFLFIPINENFHWTLIIVSFCGQDPETSTNLNRPLIMHLDSLGNYRNQFHQKVRAYLQLEWKYKKSIPSNGTIPERAFTTTTLPGSRVWVPKQDNLCDCGVFLLHYLELFCRSPEKDFDQPLKRPKWFPLSDIPIKRDTIKNLIQRLQAEQEADLEDDNETSTTTTTSTIKSIIPDDIEIGIEDQIEINEKENIEEVKEKVKEENIKEKKDEIKEEKEIKEEESKEINVNINININIENQIEKKEETEIINIIVDKRKRDQEEIEEEESKEIIKKIKQDD